jgi:ligand-binding SRPBCC domain-containing protein
MEYKFSTQQYLPISITKAWEFFSSPHNLSLITPPEMKFRMLTETDRPIYKGMVIDYTVRPIGNIPMRWKTKIGRIVVPFEFTDIQIQGPYTKWEHVHTFEPSDNGTLMTDTVTYRLPLGIIGDVVHRMLVKRKIESIFHYRQKVLLTLFPEL